MLVALPGISNQVETELQNKADLKTGWFVMEISGAKLVYDSRMRLFLGLGTNYKFRNGLRLLMDMIFHASGVLLSIKCRPPWRRGRSVPSSIEKVVCC